MSWPATSQEVSWRRCFSFCISHFCCSGVMCREDTWTYLIYESALWKRSFIFHIGWDATSPFMHHPRSAMSWNMTEATAFWCSCNVHSFQLESSPLTFLLFSSKLKAKIEFLYFCRVIIYELTRGGRGGEDFNVITCGIIYSICCLAVL